MNAHARNCFGSIAVALTVLSPSGTSAANLLYTVVIPASEFGSPAGIEFLLGGIASARTFCSKIDDAYVVDCLAERLGDIARQVPDGTDYEALDKVLADTSKKLEQLARANRDSSLPRGRATQQAGEKTTTTSRPLTPVSPSSAASVNQQAEAILAEAETLLLRSGEGSKERQLQYAKLADAIGSNKVLLRSA